MGVSTTLFSCVRVCVTGPEFDIESVVLYRPVHVLA